MEFFKDFLEGFDRFMKQKEIDGDNGSMQVSISAEKMHCAQDERHKENCIHGEFLRMMLGFTSGENRKQAEARLDVAEALRDLTHEAEVLSRIGDKPELTDEEFEKLCSVRDYLQMVLVGIRQFKEQFTASLDGGTDGK